jgi:hypothetical protein
MYYLTRHINGFPGSDYDRGGPPFSGIIPPHSVGVYDDVVQMEAQDRSFLARYPYGIDRTTADIWYYDWERLHSWVHLGNLYGQLDILAHNSGSLVMLADTAGVVPSSNKLPVNPAPGVRYLVQDVWQIVTPAGSSG